MRGGGQSCEVGIGDVDSDIGWGCAAVCDI